MAVPATPLPPGFVFMRFSLNRIISSTDHTSPLIDLALITLKIAEGFYSELHRIAESTLTIYTIRFVYQENMSLPVVFQCCRVIDRLSQHALIMWNRRETLARACSSISQFKITGVRPRDMNDNIRSALASLPPI